MDYDQSSTKPTIAAEPAVAYLTRTSMRTKTSQNKGTITEEPYATKEEESACGKAESRRQALKRDMTPEQLYSVISEEIDEIYANG